MLKIKVEEIELIKKSDEELLAISKDRLLSLNLEEMRVIRGYYQREKRNPTDIELETLARGKKRQFTICNHNCI